MLARGGNPHQEPGLRLVESHLTALLQILQGADAPPTSQAEAGVASVQKTLTELLERYGALREQELKALNDRLNQSKLPPLAP
jgi:hypothetical protein